MIETRRQTMDFYRDLVQDLKPPQPKPPKMAPAPGPEKTEGQAEPKKSEGRARREQIAGLDEIASVVQIGAMWG